jgi:hypothetical protein
MIVGISETIRSLLIFYFNILIEQGYNLIIYLKIELYIFMHFNIIFLNNIRNLLSFPKLCYFPSYAWEMKKGNYKKCIMSGWVAVNNENIIKRKPDPFNE